MSYPSDWVARMSSENPSGADDQQETGSSLLELDARWVTGFVDGEGCFSVSIHRSPHARRTYGWQVHPVFHVYQHNTHRAVLEALIDFFGCGHVRSKGRSSSVSTYAVDSLRKLEATIVPFFERNPLVVKAADFGRFAAIVGAMRRQEHFSRAGFEQIVPLAYAMNMHGKQRARSIDEILGSSETARWAPPGPRQPGNGEDTVRPPWRHGEPGRNDLAP